MFTSDNAQTRKKASKERGMKRAKKLKPFWQTTDKQLVRLYHGDVVKTLRRLSAKSVQCVVTSPPYWSLRDYGTAEWEGGSDVCDHKRKGIDIRKDPTSTLNSRASNQNHEREPWPKGVCKKCGAKRIDQQIGSEKTPEEFVEKMVEVFRQVWRVLRDDGTVWLNLGDSYGKQGLVGAPWKVALALQADGWILRQDVIYAKPNPMPESVRNRCTKSHEYLFLLTKKGSGYYCDMEAIRETSVNRESLEGRTPRNDDQFVQTGGDKATYRTGFSQIEQGKTYPTRNKRSVWNIASESYEGAHFACVDRETEALTKDGWKRHDEIIDGDEIAAYNQELDTLRWERATVFCYDVSHGLEVVEFDKRDTSQLVTPNHRCFVRSRKGIIKVKRADEITSCDSFLLAAGFEETPEWSVGKDMASLIGWYTSEGYRRKSNRFPIAISQSETANPEKVKVIECLLRKTGSLFDVTYRDREWQGKPYEEAVFNIGGPTALRLLKWCPKKEVTNRITRLPKEELSALLNAFIDGDGHRRSGGQISIIQKSPTHLEKLQIIAIKLGYRAQISKRTDGMYVLYLIKRRWLGLRGTNGEWQGIQKKHYEGVIWCPRVSSGFWLARRNGKPFITGNTFPQKLVEPCVKAGTSEKGCCDECGMTWKRVVEEKKLTRERPNDFVKRTGAEGTGNSCANSVAGVEVKTIGWEAGCKCDADVVPCVVCDPFVGSGTTNVVALGLGRRSWGVDLSADYLEKNAVPRITGALSSRPELAHLTGKIPSTELLGEEM